MCGLFVTKIGNMIVYVRTQRCPQDGPRNSRLIVLRFLMMSLSAFSLHVHRSCNAQESTTVTHNILELPSSRKAMAILRRPAAFSMTNEPLAEILNKLGETHSLTIWIDRRIDPSQPTTYRVRASDKLTIQDAFERIATNCGIEIGLIENVLYVGPKGKVSAMQLAAVQLHDELGSIVGRTGATRELLRTEPLKWEDVSSYEDVAQTISQQWAVPLTLNLPHDLLHAGAIRAPCTLATQLTVLCGGFDRKVVLDENGNFGCRTIGTQRSWRTIYSQAEVRLPTIETLVSKFPQSRIRRRGNSWEVFGDTDLHIALIWQTNRRTKSSPAARTMWRGRFKGSADDVITHFADSVSLKIQWDEECTVEQMKQFVDFQFENASTVDVLDAFAKAANLNVTLENGVVRVGL